MGDWTAKRLPFVAQREEVEESGGQVRGRASVELDECPFEREVKDQTGKVIGVECADGAAVRPCAPGDEECRLNRWMEGVKAFIRSINADAL